MKPTTLMLDHAVHRTAEALCDTHGFFTYALLESMFPYVRKAAIGSSVRRYPHPYRYDKYLLRFEMDGHPLLYADKIKPGVYLQSILTVMGTGRSFYEKLSYEKKAQKSRSY